MLIASSSFPTKRNQLLVVFVLWVLQTILINPIGEFPINDDWAFAKSVKALLETGKFFISGWAGMNLFSQAVWGTLFCLPFGFSFTALRISTLVAGFAGLWGTYDLIDKSTDNRRIAFIGTLLMLVNPMYLGLSATFMTDIPFYALAVWSLAYLVAGLKQDSGRQMLTGLLLAIVALLVRQFGMALFLGFGIAYIARKGFTVKNLLIAFGSVLIGVAVQVAFQKWASHLIQSGSIYNAQANSLLHRSFYKPERILDFLHNTFIALMYTGLFLFPYFLVFLTKNSLPALRKNGWLWLLLTGIVIGMWYYFFDGINMPIWWNTLNAFGLGPMLMRDLYFRLYGLPFPDFLHFMMIGITIGSLLGSVGILFYLIRAVRYLIQRSIPASQRAIGVLLLSVAAIYFFPLGLQGLFDRYLLFPSGLFVILIYLVQDGYVKKKTGSPLRLPLYVSVGLYITYGIFSTAATHDYLAWNRVRWESLYGLMKKGVPPTKIDGGFEFNGWYLYDGAYKSTPDKSWWWVHDDLYVIGASLLPGYTLFGQHQVNTWFPWGIQEIVVGKKTLGAEAKATH